jgi:hypothetical protein
MLAIAIRHALDVAHEVDRTLHVPQPFARGQAEHPADERAVDARRALEEEFNGAKQQPNPAATSDPMRPRVG